MNLNDFDQNNLNNLLSDGRRRHYEARIAEAKQTIADTEKKLAALPAVDGISVDLPHNTELFLPLGDLRIASDGNLYVHPTSTLRYPKNQTKDSVMLVRVRSNKTLEVTVSKNARPSFLNLLPSELKKGWNKVTRFRTE